MAACYTARLSAYPGETVILHASARANPCTIEIARVGAGRQVVLTRTDISIGEHPVPDHADREGCGWPAVMDIAVGDWPSGYYDIALTDGTGAAAHHFVCVKPTQNLPHVQSLFSRGRKEASICRAALGCTSDGEPCAKRKTVRSTPTLVCRSM